MICSPTTRTKLWSLLAVCVALALLATACSDSGDDPDPTDPPDNGSAPEEVMACVGARRRWRGRRGR